MYSLCEVNNFEHAPDVKLIYVNDEVMMFIIVLISLYWLCTGLL